MPPLPLISVQQDSDGLLAQLVEQLTFNQLVAGSNPAQPTTIFPLQDFDLYYRNFFYALKWYHEHYGRNSSTGD